MPLHASTFDYHAPSDDQMAKMALARVAAAHYAAAINELMPEGPDKNLRAPPSAGGGDVGQCHPRSGR
jgi:hypothetical protein